MPVRLARELPDCLEELDASLLIEFGNLLIRTGRLGEAERALREALGVYRDLAVTEPGAYLSDVATTLNSLGALLSDTGRLDEAEGVLAEAKEILDVLAANSGPS